MNKKFFSIAIDGPSGSGKSSLAKNLASKLGFAYLDTGALYRAIGLYTFRNGVDSKDAENVISGLADIDIDVNYENSVQKIFLNGEDVSLEIRENHISKYASDVSKIPAVREFLLRLQREKAGSGNIIMDGRDIGTVILPDASLKIFLTASPEKRAKRRYEELMRKSAENGEDKEDKANFEYAQILNEITERDAQDTRRDAAPLKVAADAVLLDNSDFASPDDTLQAVLKIIRERAPDVCIR